MRVYPVNAMEASQAVSAQISHYTPIENLWNKYMEVTADFTGNTHITFIWESGVSMNTFIIGNTNALRGRIRCFFRDSLFWEKHFEIDEYIKIVRNINKDGNLQTAMCNRIELNLEGIGQLYAGYAFMGEEWELPRFVAAPGRSTQLRNSSDRTFSGQVTGIPQETLKTFSVEFARVEQEWFKVIDDYINGVQTVIPHVIDPYYKAHNKFPPMFATLTSFGEQEKRVENGFKWNFGMSWMEAR